MATGRAFKLQCSCARVALVLKLIHREYLISESRRIHLVQPLGRMPFPIDPFDQLVSMEPLEEEGKKREENRKVITSNAAQQPKL